MSAFDAYLSDTEKAVIIQQRIKQFASEGYQQELNKELAQKSENQEAVEQTEVAIEAIKGAITVQEEALAKLDLSDPEN